jgi:hypothetical protein
MPEFFCKFPFKQAYFLVAIYIFKLRTKAFYVDEDSTLQYVISKRLRLSVSIYNKSNMAVGNVI